MMDDQKFREAAYARPHAVCTGCSKRPVELMEYTPTYTGSGMDAENYVWAEEGTLNRDNGHFLCTRCYIKAGQPSSPRGWTAP